MAKLKEEDARALRAFLNALGEFTKLGDENMPLQQIRAFVYVALHEGEGTMDLAKRTSIDNTVLSRYVAELDDLNRYKEKGLDLIYQEMDPQDKRTRKAYLTKDGITKRHELVRAMQH